MNTTTNWMFVIMATALTCFFGLLLVAMIAGVKGVESGMQYNGRVLECIFVTLLI